MPVPLVLVHGGAHGAWCWEPVLPHLSDEVLAIDLPPKPVRRGFSRHAPELATLTLRDFVDSALADIDTAGYGRFALAGHSMGGLTISEIARRAPDRVAHLVYVSCIVPPEGGTAIDAMPGSLREMTRQAVEEGRTSDANAVRPDEATIRFMFCNDMNEQQSRFVIERTGAEVTGILAESVSRSGIPSELPKTFVKLLRDQSLPPDVQDAQVENLRRSPGGEVDVVALDAGHDVMISRPRELAVVLDRVAATA